MEIIERHRKGITLDSLEKQKKSRQKSLTKYKAQRDTVKKVKYV